MAINKGRHKSVHKELKRSINRLETTAGVDRVIIGISESCRHKFPPGTIKFQRVALGGFHANGYSGNGVMRLFVKVDKSKMDEVVSKL